MKGEESRDGGEIPGQEPALSGAFAANVGPIIRRAGPGSGRYMSEGGMATNQAELVSRPNGFWYPTQCPNDRRLPVLAGQCRTIRQSRSS